MSTPLPLPGGPGSWLDYLRDTVEAAKDFARHPRAVLVAAYAGLALSSWCLGRHMTEPSMVPVAAAAPLPSIPGIAWLSSDGTIYVVKPGGRP
jgi:hypothetical protein